MKMGREISVTYQNFSISFAMSNKAALQNRPKVFNSVIKYFLTALDYFRFLKHYRYKKVISKLHRGEASAQMIPL
jgi:hypothetical protein